MDFDVVLRQRDLQVLNHRIQGHWFSHVVGGHEHVVTCGMHTPKDEKGCRPENDRVTRGGDTTPRKETCLRASLSRSVKQDSGGCCATTLKAGFSADRWQQLRLLTLCGCRVDSYAPDIFVRASSTIETLPANRSISPNRVSCTLRVAVCVSSLQRIHTCVEACGSGFRFDVS